MEAKKNLCGMIPEELHARAVAEKEQLGLKTLGEYVELILKEHFERPANKSQVEISDLGERQKDNTKSSR